MPAWNPLLTLPPRPWALLIGIVGFVLGAILIAAVSGLIHSS